MKLCALVLMVASAASYSQSNPLAKGPDPTNASVQAVGPFAISQQTLRGRGFRAATIYSPNTAGQYALVAFCPGFTARQSSIAVLARRLASHGFVVATIDTNSTLDLPPSRGTQLLAALRQVAALQTGAVAGKIDPSRLVVTGHSMGGGGSLFASRDNRAIKASVPLAPFSSTKTFATPVPQFIVGGERDDVAPVAQHSIPFFNGLPVATPRVYAALRAEDHFFPNEAAPNQPTGKFQLAWIKRFADNDARYDQFLNAAGLQVEVNNGRLSDLRRAGF
jgi:triacylglycerol lipase